MYIYIYIFPSLFKLYIFFQKTTHLFSRLLFEHDLHLSFFLFAWYIEKILHLSSLSLTQSPLTRTSFSLSIPSNPSLFVVPPTLTCFRANHCYNFILSFPLFVELSLNFFIPVSFSLPTEKHKHKSNGYAYTLSNEKVFYIKLASGYAHEHMLRGFSIFFFFFGKS